MPAGAPAAPVLEVDHLIQRFRVPGGTLEAVSDVSFTIGRGATLGLVGESGSGKSSIGRAVIQLPPPAQGAVRLDGRDLTTLSKAELRDARSGIQMIFQDPVSALNPRRRVRDIVAEGPAILGWPRERAEQRVAEILTQVGLDPAAFGDRRPHQLSGGQCQRVAIARALIVEPRMLICDEPVASLDVSVQGQILNLLEDMRGRYGLSMLFISHDLSVVHAVSDQIGVMYLGQVVEYGDADVITREPSHPYTRGLLDAVPVPDPHAALPETRLRGEIPSPMSPPSGCRFRTRCGFAQDRCATEAPVLRPIDTGQVVACHFPLHGGAAPAVQEPAVAEVTNTSGQGGH
ncbi:MAG TPA: oligopeptide/dipeptide ABC transporter ATP-binding protein [Trebonia sp.]|jgi:peptide/nickel transport system ATP-binding protein|nr:oligopeptide/dipeptide ABC transporter ATP-binding protein [Trebonia sp.]